MSAEPGRAPRRRSRLAIAALHLLLLAGFAGVSGSCGGRRGPAVEGASLRVRGGPALQISYLGRPTRRVIGASAGVRDPSVAGSFAASIRLRVEEPSWVRFFVVAPRARLLELESHPPVPDDGFPPGTHAMHVAPGPWGYTMRNPCDVPCYLVALAATRPLGDHSPWGVPPIAPGFTQPDSLMVWVAGEVIDRSDSVSWTGAYRRLPPGGQW